MECTIRGGVGMKLQQKQQLQQQQQQHLKLDWYKNGQMKTNATAKLLS